MPRSRDRLRDLDPEQIVGRSLIGDETVDDPALECGAQRLVFAPALGDADNRRAVTRRQRNRGDALIDAVGQEHAFVVEHPTADFAGSARRHQPCHFIARQEPVFAKRRVGPKFADAHEGSVRLGAEFQGDLHQALLVQDFPLFRRGDEKPARAWENAAP